MPLYFTEIVYRRGNLIEDVDQEIKYFKDETEVERFKNSPKKFGGRVEYVKEVLSLDEIFFKNTNLVSKENHVDYYEKLRSSLGDKINIFPKPDFSDSYLEHISNLRQEMIDEEMESEEYDKYYREQGHGDPFGWKPDWEQLSGWK